VPSRYALGLALAALALAVSQDAPASSNTSRHPCLVVASTSDATFTRNFNPYSAPVEFTWAGIYEPLVVVTRAGGGHTYDWLASRLAWSRDRRTLTLTVRPGVKWSDGRPLTNRDVLFTLTAGRRDKAMDQIGLRRPGNEVASIRLAGRDGVAIRLQHPDSTFVAKVLASNLYVVPEHIFARVRRVSAWSNPHPVGTGPFAVVRSFTTQSYILARNPHYWRRGAPHFACLETVFAPTREAALLQMLSGSVDLTNDFIPNVERAYVSQDPAHFHYFYATAGLPVGLFFDDSVYPYSLPALRKAISMAINRHAISQFAEYGYGPPANAIGIEHNWAGWATPAIAAEARRLATYDPAAAKRTLLAAGFSYANGSLNDPRGHPVELRATVISGWTDWVAAWQVIVKNLRRIGIVVDLHLAPSWGAWQPSAFATKTATLLWNNAGNGPTPYDYFQEHFDRAAYIPPGRQADRTGNWEHYWSPTGTRLLSRFRRTFARSGQRRLAQALERLWLRTLPYVPLYVGPTWSTYSTRYFTGFPSAHDYYDQPGFFTTDYVVALTRIRPVR
jgi:peptide/nickel transport system substrate-binding protein